MKRYYLVSYCCAVCGKNNTECSLSYCPRCYFVRYCSRECQTKDWNTYHKQCCKNLCQLRRAINDKKLNYEPTLGDINSCLTFFQFQFEWYKAQFHIDDAYAIQYTILLQRCCHECFIDSSQAKLQSCPLCGYATFCEQHREKVMQEHAHVCKAYKLMLQCHRVLNYELNMCGKQLCTMDISRYLIERSCDEFPIQGWDALKYLGQNHGNILDNNHNSQYNKDFYTNHRIHENSNINDINSIGCMTPNLSEEAKFALDSIELSWPWTILYALWACNKYKEIISYPNNTQHLCVYLLGASQVEQTKLPIFESILHFLPELKTLQFYFVGPDLAEFDEEENVSLELCKEFQQCGKHVHFRMYCSYFHEIEWSDWEQPNLVVCYNSGIHEDPEHWVPTLLQLVKVDVCVFTTAYTKGEIDSDVSIIQKFTNCLSILEPQENPFKVLQPLPDFFSGRYQCYSLNEQIYGFRGTQE